MQNNSMCFEEPHIYWLKLWNVRGIKSTEIQDRGFVLEKEGGNWNQGGDHMEF